MSEEHICVPQKGAQGRRSATALCWIGGAVAALLILLVIALAVVQANADALRGPISRMASTRLKRTVELQGLSLHILTPRPHAIITGLRIGGPPWARSAYLAHIGHAEVWVSLPRLLMGRVVLPFVGVRDIDVQLVRNNAGQGNWRLRQPEATEPPPGTPLKLPFVRTMDIGPGRLHIKDELHELRFDGTVMINAQARGGQTALHLDGHGNMNGASFQLAATGQPLMRAETHRPYTFDADIHAGATHANARVTVLKPFDLGALAFNIKVTGDDFADLYYLTGLALPNSSPYKAHVSAERDGNLVKIRELSGTLGHSDVHGSGQIDISSGHPVVKADLETRQLYIADLGPTLGGVGAAKPAPGSLSQNPENQPGAPAPAKDTAHAERLLPDAPLDLRRVRGTDADVTYRADSIKERNLDMRRMEMQLSLHRGVLTIRPLSVSVPPQGTFQGGVVIDASHDVPDTFIDMAVRSVQLSQVRLGKGPPPLGGTLLGRLQLHGRGASVHQVASTASGTATLVVLRGEIRQAFAELAGINVAEGLGLLLTGDQKKVVVQCGVANFKGDNGLVTAQSIVLDTDTVAITGKGHVHLGDEALNFSLAGHAKEPRLVRLRTPILIQGTLRRPEVGVQPRSVLAQAGVAAALGVVFTPIGSILAFVDPGLAKDPNCAALINQAAQEGAPLKQAAGGTKPPDRR